MNMKRILLLTVGLLSLSMAGCGSIVVTDTTTFYKPDYQNRGTISVTAANQQINKSLQFAHYKSRFEKQLGKLGFKPVQQSSAAKYVAIVSYGIDNGKTSVETSPVYGQTGGGTTYSSGTVNHGGHSTSYSGSSYSMPTYGIVGSTSSSYTRYSRAIAMDIVEGKSFHSGRPIALLEARAKSSGSCSQIVEVFDEMLEAMFDEFPGESGRSRRVTVSADVNC